MCGIVVAVGPGAPERVTASLPRLVHRGPDARGRVDLGACSMGATRLAVQDPTPRADQPMTRGGVTLVFNGEIYNFKDLRGELVALGHEFATSGDTEVVLTAILEWGVGALPRLMGMFAMAWWTDATQSLVAARDRFGIKPLYWSGGTGTGVALASEVQALRGSKSTLSVEAVCEFLRMGSPIASTIDGSVSELLPGHLLEVDSRGIRIASWIADDAAPQLELQPPWPALQSAVRSHLVADRKLGIFLSGGFDSAMIARCVKDAGARPVAITLDTGHNQFDVAGAVRTARHYGLEHHVATIDVATLPDLLESFVAAQDQPTIDGLNTYLVSRVAVSLECAVALSGLGGDEVLGGYGYYSNAVSHRLIRRVPRGVMRRVSSPLSRLTRHPAARLTALAGAREPVDRFIASREVFSVDEVRVLSGVVTSSRLGLGTDRAKPIMRQLAELDFDVYLRATLLRDADTFSMSHGLEMRVPMLDAGVVGSLQACDVPATKSSLARAAADPYLRQLAGQRKRGFTLPWHAWLPQLGSVRADALTSPDPWAGVIEPAAGRRTCGQFDDDPMRAWALLVLALWLRRHPWKVS